MQQAKAPWILLAILYIGSLLAFWPGVMSPDAISQYQAAISGIYTDHHPPAMSLLWRYLNMIYSGPGLIFLLHLSLLYTAAAIFVYIFRTSKFKWWYVVYPLIPNLLAYTIFIVKDAGFVYTYLLAGAILSLIIVNRQQKFKWLLLLICILLLFYGTAVKFQARYLLIFYCLGLGYCFSYRFNFKTILVGIGICVAILSAMFGLNTVLVPNAQQSHSWQLVKLYDLTAMSIALDAPLYPDFVKQNPNFNFTEIKKIFNPQKVDELVFDADPVLISGKTEQQRQVLWNYWFDTVRNHPLIYLKIRCKLWSYNLFSVPSEYNDPTKFLKSTMVKPLLENVIVDQFINTIYRTAIYLFNFIWLLPLLLFYAFLSIRNFTRSNYAAPLAIFSYTSLAMLLILLFFSMAGVARYVLLCTALVHASHGFAFRSLKRQ